ncbi:type 1 glutamine amidotransferase [Patescibacteria group bacterium]
MKLNIGYFYPKELNLYGDTGNVEILMYRAKKRGIPVELYNITSETKLTSHLMHNLNLIFMGGGPDSGQKVMYKDLIDNKGPYLKDFIENQGSSLFICGSYQLMGHYYKSADGSELKGLGIFDHYTEHFGHSKQRCVGNVVCKLEDTLLNDSTFKSINKVGPNIVGFENHGGCTYLNKNLKPLAKIISGFGNNGEDDTEGAFYKSSLGTYFHGPILSKNPHIADFLIAKALKISELSNIDDNIIMKAHSALIKRFSN